MNNERVLGIKVKLAANFKFLIRLRRQHYALVPHEVLDVDLGDGHRTPYLNGDICMEGAPCASWWDVVDGICRDIGSRVVQLESLPDSMPKGRVNTRRDLFRRRWPEGTRFVE